MANILNRLLGREPKSAQKAKERLQMVLIHDRIDLTNNMLEELKDDLIAAISKHIDIDPDSVNIQINQDGRQQRLIADIPINTPRKRTRRA